MNNEHRRSSDEHWKWGYTFVLLFVTIIWAGISVFVVYRAMNQPNGLSVLEASGTSILLGALIVWNGNVNQFWFRKRPSDPDITVKPS
jgi:cation transporter-like permease